MTPTLQPINLPVQFKKIAAKSDFKHALVEYFKLFWEKHSLSRDWMALDTAEWMTEEKPYFHGLVLAINTDEMKLFKDYIETIMAKEHMRLSMRSGDTRFNRAGEFTFLDINNNKNKSLPAFLNGRVYDLIVVVDFIPTQDMVDTFMSFTRDKNPDRIVCLKEEGFDEIVLSKHNPSQEVTLGQIQ